MLTTNIIKKACANLLSGHHDASQSANVRPFLQELKAKGLATYDATDGWNLTEAGMAAALAKTSAAGEAT